MRFAILVGGRGTRLSELTKTVNKPLLEVGGIPLVMHVAVRFFLAGARKISLLVGHESNRFLVRFEETRSELLRAQTAPAAILTMLETVEFVFFDAGPSADTFERVRGLFGPDPVMVTYGDTLTDINVREVIDFWIANDKNAALTCVVRPPKRFSSVIWDKQSKKALCFEEKKGLEASYVGCGFIILPSQNSIPISQDFKSLETDVLPWLVENRKLLVYEHMGFWLPIDYVCDIEDARDVWKRSTQPHPVWMI